LVVVVRGQVGVFAQDDVVDDVGGAQAGGGVEGLAAAGVLAEAFVPGPFGVPAGEVGEWAAGLGEAESILRRITLCPNACARWVFSTPTGPLRMIDSALASQRRAAMPRTAAVGSIGVGVEVEA
jgi:hypothetical protein